jgi:hypothetical protein
MYQKVENRALFKKSSAARDKLMELGGVSPQAGGLQSMAPPPPMPQKPMGIMASSPDLMQAAMRKAPVLPTQQGMAPPAPMPQAPPAPLPASQPMPNIAGIAPVPTNPAPRPPLKPGVKKFADGKEVRTMSDVMVPGLATAFQTAFEFGQKAITSENPEDLGVPQENAQEVRATLKKIEEDPKAMGEEVVNSTLTSEEKTKDLKTNLKKVAEKSGISDVPVSATVDQLNTAIAGAKLGAAIAGNYVNPNTGEQLRPTAGARIGQAVSEGLAVKRDTAEKRETAEQAMKLQRLKNAGKSTKDAKLPQNFETLVDIFAKRAETQAIDKTAKEFDDYFKDNTGTKIMNYLRGGPPTSGTPAPGTPAPGDGETSEVAKTPEQILDDAREVLAGGADPKAVADRLIEMGIDPGSL